jgi:hypothetical protein
LPPLIRDSLKQTGLDDIKINNKKTVFSSKKFNRHITGVTLSNDDKILWVESEKRIISAMVHHFK